MIMKIVGSTIHKILKGKELKNAIWIIGGRIVQMILSFFVSILTARYLGAADYGLINYAQAYVTFFTAFCTLGINAVIIKDFVDYPDEQGMTIGTTLALRGISSFFSSVMIILVSLLIDKGEIETIIVVALSSVGLIFQIFDTFNYWFQSRYQSKVTSIATLVAYLSISIYKTILLITGKKVQWFAFSTALDYIVIGIVLFVAYKKYKGPKLQFSTKKAKDLLGKSYHYILSSVMVAIYGQTDKLMLKHMMNETEVGYYSIASSLCSTWVFVLQAIIDSLYPTILNLYSVDKTEFNKRNKQLYAIIFYISCIVSLLFTIFAKPIISIMYGEQYSGAIMPLKIICWYTAFSYLGVARNAWLVCNNKQKHLKYIYMGAAVINLFLNVLLIPLAGASGAALASLITQICTSIILPYMFRNMRENAKLMIDAILLKNVFDKKGVK